MKKLLCFLTHFCIATSSLSGLWAQQSIHTAGGDAAGQGGTVAYSIGQVAYTSVSAESGQVSQGVQQSNLVIMVGQAEPVPSVEIALFPNPVHDNAFLRRASDHHIDGANISYELYTVYGALLKTGIIELESTVVPMDKYQDGFYILRIVRDRLTLKTFKVVKTD